MANASSVITPVAESAADMVTVKKLLDSVCVIPQLLKESEILVKNVDNLVKACDIIEKRLSIQDTKIEDLTKRQLAHSIIIDSFVKTHEEHNRRFELLTNTISMLEKQDLEKDKEQLASLALELSKSYTEFHHNNTRFLTERFNKLCEYLSWIIYSNDKQFDIDLLNKLMFDINPAIQATEEKVKSTTIAALQPTKVKVNEIKKTK